MHLFNWSYNANSRHFFVLFNINKPAHRSIKSTKYKATRVTILMMGRSITGKCRTLHPKTHWLRPLWAPSAMWTTRRWIQVKRRCLCTTRSPIRIKRARCSCTASCTSPSSATIRIWRRAVTSMWSLPTRVLCDSNRSLTVSRPNTTWIWSTWCSWAK